MEEVTHPIPGFRLRSEYQLLLADEPTKPGRSTIDFLGRPVIPILSSLYLGTEHPDWHKAYDYSENLKQFPGQFTSRGYQ